MGLGVPKSITVLNFVQDVCFRRTFDMVEVRGTPYLTNRFFHFRLVTFLFSLQETSLGGLDT